MRTEIVNVSDIQAGDTVIIEGQDYTICQKDISSTFFGTTIRGVSFRGSKNMVERVLYPKWYQGKIVEWVAQV